MPTITTNVDRKCFKHFRNLVAESNETSSSRLRRVISDYVENPAPLADNIGPIPAHDSGMLNVTIDEDLHSQFLAQAKQKPGKTPSSLLRTLVYDHVEQCKPETFRAPDPKPRKTMVFLDHKPATWHRPAFWSGVTAADVERVTGCSNTAAYKLVRELGASDSLALVDKTLALRPEVGFEETTEQFFGNLLKATLAEQNAFLACGASPAVKVKLPAVKVSIAILKTLLTAMSRPNQLVDALISGNNDIVRFAPLEFVFDGGRWLLRANEYFLMGGLLGEKMIPIDDIEEADLVVARQPAKEAPKRGRKPKAKPEVETFDKSNRLLVPAGRFEVGQMLAGQKITKLGRSAFDAEFDQVMQYAYF